MLEVWFGFDQECIRDIDLFFENVYDEEWMEDAYIDLIVCGENCQKWIAKIAAQKNIKVGMSGYDLTFADEDISGICLNDHTEFHDAKEWTLKMCSYVEDEDEGKI